jgi:hypothetical protein
MKAIELLKMKAVNYHGTEVHVPDNIHFIATDKNGKTLGFEERPKPDEEFNWWENPNRSDMYDIGTFDLEDTNWTETLVQL